MHCLVLHKPSNKPLVSLTCPILDRMFRILISFIYFHKPIGFNSVIFLCEAHIKAPLYKYLNHIHQIMSHYCNKQIDMKNVQSYILNLLFCLHIAITLTSCTGTRAYMSIGYQQVLEITNNKPERRAIIAVKSCHYTAKTVIRY